MWAVLWNAWLRGNETKVTPELDFCWATDTINRWEETSIFHNAGATPDRKDIFFKGPGGTVIHNLLHLYILPSFV
jgi:hypothetical protein